MNRRVCTIAVTGLALLAGLSCVPASQVSSSILGTPDPTGEPFVAFSIIERTFTAGRAVATHTFAPTDLTRTPIAIDFDGDGRADPVIGYGSDTTEVVPHKAVVQILLSQGPPGTVNPLSLTLDKPGERGDVCPGMAGLLDLAVGDIDDDGKLDIIVASGPAQPCVGGLFYLHHPKGTHPTGRPLNTTDLRYWDINQIDASGELVDANNSQILNMIQRALPLGCTLDDFQVEVDQRFNQVELADLDADGDLDIVASQFIKITLIPIPGGCTDKTIRMASGGIALLSNPGGDATGQGWTSTVIGIHERFAEEVELDRAGASGLFLVDMDVDGDFDIVSSAQLDNNVQVSWFSNPLVPDSISARACFQSGDMENRDEWCQWRIGAVRDAHSVDVGDVTGDGRLDVVATGKAQKQVVLFQQPDGTGLFGDAGPKREFDWDTFVVAKFDQLEPIGVHIVDIDGDGVVELVIGATEGAVRRFDRPADAQAEWSAGIVYTFDTGGSVGLLGLVDLDDDGDFDLVGVLDGEDETGNEDLVAWIRNDL